MNGTPDEEVDYGSCGSSANPLITDSNANLECLNLDFSSQVH